MSWTRLRSCHSSLRVGVAGVKSDGFSKILNGFGRESLRQQFPSARHVEPRVGLGIARGQALFIGGLNLRGDLAEGIFIVGVLDAFGRKLGR